MSVSPELDRYGRPLESLRLSVTDRCNLRCSYCMPEENYRWLPRRDLLTFEELSSLVDVFADLGVSKVRLTGGEPLLRRDLSSLVGMLARKPGIRDLALTTNGVLLADQAAGLQEAGLGRVTISLDSLDRTRYRELTRRDDLDRTLAGIDACVALGFRDTKVNTVLMRGTNDDELVALLDFGRERGVEIRLIEYMDVGGATHWSPDVVVPREEILARLRGHYGSVEPVGLAGAAPAERFRLPDGSVFGIIASTTSPFCGACDRSRLTADGMWYLCLYARTGIDLRGALRAGESPEEIARRILPSWRERDDRGAEERLAQVDRSAIHPPDALRRDPHLEMHTRGG